MPLNTKQTNGINDFLSHYATLGEGSGGGRKTTMYSFCHCEGLVHQAGYEGVGMRTGDNRSDRKCRRAYSKNDTNLTVRWRARCPGTTLDEFSAAGEWCICWCDVHGLRWCRSCILFYRVKACGINKTQDASRVTSACSDLRFCIVWTKERKKNPEG